MADFHSVWRRLGAGILFLGIILTVGCTHIRSEYGQAFPRMGDPVKEPVTVSGVLATYGPPSKVSSLGDGFAFLYEHAVVREKQLGLSIDYFWLKYFKLALGRAVADRETCVMTFDKEGRLLSSGYRQWSETLGGGSSVQMIISVMSVVDTGEIDDSPSSIKWGANLLRSRLTESLNAQNSMDTGSYGLEQTGTPIGAGQRTLEAGTFPILNLNAF